MENKGQLNGACNLSSCKSGLPATFYNYGSRSHYCKPCAMRLNADDFNKRDAMRLFGHDLCLEVKQETINQLQNICVFIEDEKQLQEAMELLERFGQKIEKGYFIFHNDEMEDNERNHIWYSELDNSWGTATVIFEDDTFITINELEKLLEDELRAKS